MHVSRQLFPKKQQYPVTDSSALYINRFVSFLIKLKYIATCLDVQLKLYPYRFKLNNVFVHISTQLKHLRSFNITYDKLNICNLNNWS